MHTSRCIRLLQKQRDYLQKRVVEQRGSPAQLGLFLGDIGALNFAIIVLERERANEADDEMRSLIDNYWLELHPNGQRIWADSETLAAQAERLLKFSRTGTTIWHCRAGVISKILFKKAIHPPETSS